MVERQHDNLDDHVQNLQHQGSWEKTRPVISSEATIPYKESLEMLMELLAKVAERIRFIPLTREEVRERYESNPLPGMTHEQFSHAVGEGIRRARATGRQTPPEEHK